MKPLTIGEHYSHMDISRRVVNCEFIPQDEMTVRSYNKVNYFKLASNNHVYAFVDVDTGMYLSAIMPEEYLTEPPEENTNGLVHKLRRMGF